MRLPTGFEQMLPIKVHSSVGQTVDTQYFHCGVVAVHKTQHVVNDCEEPKL